MAVASTLGIVLALCRVYGGGTASGLALTYIEFMRGTPLLVQLYFIYYGLPQLGEALRPFFDQLGVPGLSRIFTLSSMTAGVAGVGLNYAAYEAEIYRAGIMAIPRSQSEAAAALGLTRFQTIRLVVLPQAFRLVIPPVTNDFVALFKDTSIVSVVALQELTDSFRKASTSTNRHMEFAIVTALIYFLLAYPLSRLARRLEKRIHPHHDHDTQPL
ncbi:MAG: amino acid ABC transporter permease [Candidatus Sumerlaeaceae bacterium]|nr:amino acid ABC transporter permease [Candidatus Sumerlaeaceae bacterium]